MDHVLNLLTDRRQILAGETPDSCQIPTGQNLRVIIGSIRFYKSDFDVSVLMQQILMRQNLAGEHRQPHAVF